MPPRVHVVKGLRASLLPLRAIFSAAVPQLWNRGSTSPPAVALRVSLENATVPKRTFVPGVVRNSMHGAGGSCAVTVTVRLALSAVKAGATDARAATAATRPVVQRSLVRISISFLRRGRREGDVHGHGVTDADAAAARHLDLRRGLLGGGRVERERRGAVRADEEPVLRRQPDADA